MKDAHIFDNFYNDFERILRDIYRKNGKDIELIINLSQGTPAMKSALHIVGAMANSNIRLVQVSDPTPKSQREPAPFDVQEEWKNDLDNLLQEEWDTSNEKEKLNNPNRTLEIQNKAFYNRIQRENITKLIQSYDYEAAFLIAKDIESGIPTKAFSLLKAAQYRICLKQKLCLQILREIECSDLMPYTGQKGDIYEYALWLSIKQMRNDYTDFFRGMTPLLYAISKYYVETNLKVPIEDYCRKNTEENHGLHLNIAKLKQTEEGKKILNDMNQFSDNSYALHESKYLSTDFLISIIQARNEKKQDTKDFQMLRNIEKCIRNRIAHQIYASDNEDIKRETGYNTKEIMDVFKRLLHSIGFTINENTWNLYNKMNEQIVNLLKI